MAAQFKVMNGPSRRELSPWMARATNSFPVPVFSEDQHVGIRRRNHLCLSLDALQSGAVSDHLLELLRNVYVFIGRHFRSRFAPEGPERMRSTET